MWNVKDLSYDLSLSLCMCIIRCSFLEQIWWGAELNVVTRTMPFKLRRVNLKWWFYSSNQRESSLCCFWYFLFTLMDFYTNIYSYNFLVAIIVFAVLLTIFYASYFSFLAWKTFDIINWLPKQKRSSLLAGRSIVYFVSYCIISYCIEKIYHKQRLCVN